MAKTVKEYNKKRNKKITIKDIVEYKFMQHNDPLELSLYDIAPPSMLTYQNYVANGGSLSWECWES